MSLLSMARERERERSVLWESRCLVPRNVIFTALLPLRYTDGLPSSSRIVRLSVPLSVCLSVNQLTRQGHQVSPCAQRYLSALSMGIFDVIPHAVKWLNFSPSLSGVFPNSCRCARGPEVIGNAGMACCHNNIFACFRWWLFLGSCAVPPHSLHFSVFLPHVLLSLSLSLSLVLSVQLSPACAMWRKVALCSARVGSIRDESVLQW